MFLTAAKVVIFYDNIKIFSPLLLLLGNNCRRFRRCCLTAVIARGGILRCERLPFGFQYAAFHAAKDGVLYLVGCQCVAKDVWAWPVSAAEWTKNKGRPVNGRP